MYEQVGRLRLTQLAKNPIKSKQCPVSVCFTKSGETRLLRCGKWNCPHCSRLLSKKWAKRVIRFIEWENFIATGDPQSIMPRFYFMTFTLKGKRLSIHKAYELLPVLWERLRKRFQRMYADWQYIAFVEGQPKRQNMPHFHVISNYEPPAKRNAQGVITQHNMHNFAHSVGFGFEADLQPVDTITAAFYVTKYMSKQGTEAPKNFRRVRASAGVEKLPPNTDKKYIVRSRGEGVMQYIARVADVTGQNPIDLYMKFALTWAENEKKLPPFPRKW